MIDVQNILPSDVMCAYSGKPGCMCGCNGNYWTTCQNRAEAEADHGYTYEDVFVDIVQATRILRLLQAEVCNGYEKTDFGPDLAYVYVEDYAGHCYAVYLTKHARERLAPESW